MARGKQGAAREQRPHRPDELGPRIFDRGRWKAADLRPWGGGRPTLRDPRAPGWPKRGDRTEDGETARRWAWAYVDHYRGAAKRAHLGLPGDSERLDEAVRRYLRHSERMDAAPRTVEGRTTILGHLEDHFGGDALIAEIDRAALQRFFNGFIDRGYAATTLRTMLRVASGLFTFLEAEPNPARGVDLPDPPEDDVRDWTDEQAERIRKAADQVDAQRIDPPSARRAVELAFASGLRQQELFAVDAAEIDPDTYTARITRQLDRPGKHRRRLKGKRSRTVLLLPSWWEWHPESEGVILAGPAGPLGARLSHRLLERVLDTAGLNERGIGWHRFRHTYARWFLEMGGSLEQLQRSLGHSSIRTTERCYDHFRPRKAALSAAETIYGKTGKLRVI